MTQMSRDSGSCLQGFSLPLNIMNKYYEQQTEWVQLSLAQRVQRSFLNSWIQLCHRSCTEINVVILSWSSVDINTKKQSNQNYVTFPLFIPLVFSPLQSGWSYGTYKKNQFYIKVISQTLIVTNPVISRIDIFTAIPSHQRFLFSM